MNYPNLLVISNNSLSNNISNGRTLAGFLHGWNKKNIAQIYITGELPESEVCDNFFRITDKEVLRGVVHRKNIGRTVSNTCATLVAAGKRKIKKTVFTVVARDFIWNTGIWFGKKLKNWLNDFKPQIILFFAGESTFTFNMTLKIAREYKIPIVVYNSEGYYFKDRNYIVESGISSLMYPVFHKAYRRAFDRLMKDTEYIIYANGKLKRDFDKCFNVPSTVMYTSTNIKKADIKTEHRIPQISYLGNLGVGRHKALCEVADALQEINKDYKIDVYGKTPNDDVKAAFECCQGINYAGFISYDNVVKKMQESDLLVHAESFSDFYRWDLKYAFTTKIADSLACGTCFFVYAPEELACTEYLKNITCVATDKSQLVEKLKEVLDNEGLRNQYISKGLKLVEKNHRMDVNCKRFKEIIFKAVENHESNAN